MTPSLRTENERIAAKINAVRGEKVAWVEDVAHQRGDHTVLLPIVKSKLINGRLPGRAACPPFFAGPAPSYKR